MKDAVTRAPSTARAASASCWTATDGGPDKFWIKTRQTSDDSIVHDNQIGGGDTADPTTALHGGSIKIHKG